MEKPSVTIKHPEYYMAGGFAFVASLGLLVYAVSAPADEKLLGWIMCVVIFLCSLFLLGFGDSMEIIDENGIYYKGFVKEYRWTWSEVLEVSVASVPNRKAFTGRHPEIYITLKGGTPRRLAGDMWVMRNLATGIQFEYRRKTWECICYYYGPSELDEWGKPPTVS